MGGVSGFGVDIHRFAKGRKLILGGADIPCEYGLEGHSDGDALIHALADAILGAAALGDIGEHFPDTDPAYEGISSMVILERVKEIVSSKGFSVYNADCTLVMDAPRITPYKDAMRENISGVLGMDKSRINVKATTAEGLGFAGRGEGVCAFALAVLSRHCPQERNNAGRGTRGH